MDRFWSKVEIREPDECWPWTAAVNERSGYGVYHPTHGETVGAHRYALASQLGRPLQGWALHTCDNPPCCNPAHLFEGTNADNVADMVAKGRQARGSMKARTAKLTEAVVVRLREEVAAGEKSRDVATRLGVTEALVSMIVRGQRWQHAGGPLTFHYRKEHQDGQ